MPHEDGDNQESTVVGRIDVFGEPWRADHENYNAILRDRNGAGVSCLFGEAYSGKPIAERADRIVACVNACAGMQDPAAEIAELVRCLKYARCEQCGSLYMEPGPKGEPRCIDASHSEAHDALAAIGGGK